MSEKNVIKKAWLYGAGLILFIVIGDIALRTSGFGGSEWLLYVVWGLFMAAVFISTYFAPRHKIIVGMSHTLTVSVLFAFFNWAQSRLGMSVDLEGAKGFGVAFSLIYVTSFIPALIASIAGLLFSKKSEEQDSP